MALTSDRHTQKIRTESSNQCIYRRHAYSDIDDEDWTLTDRVSGIVFEPKPEAVAARKLERAKAKAQTKKA